ncbi:LRR domain containing protein [Parasponia andersonii]|uniref:LRR domain containing protein n=1 Tax=Parasponia andersonii TaxID=3476 RepID=A0A2P5AX54_PARAD|nr:LRR domain containing protein [Parasponia andersonii]
MVQVGLRDHTGKGVNTFPLHDLTRDFCMSKSKDEGFFKIIEHNDEMIDRKMAHYSSTTNSRRIAVHDNDGHLERRSPQSLSIGNLRNLHTLDLRAASFVYLQGTLSSLSRLRHMLIRWYDYRPSACSCALPITRCTALFGKHTLRNIVTLKGIRAKDLIRHDGVLELTNIRDLGIRKFRSDREVCLVLNSLGSQFFRLRSLEMNFFEGEFPNLEVLSHCHVLSKLNLWDFFSAKPGRTVII